MVRWRMMVAAAALTAGLVTATPARAEYAEDAGWGVLSVFANLVYMPVKLTYGVLGGVTGGLAYACTGGDLDTANAIWKPSLGGTYALTPAMIRGEEPIAFAGDAGGGGSSTDSSVSDGAPADPPVQRGRREESLPNS
jgi:hypothetical protein